MKAWLLVTLLLICFSGISQTKSNMTTGTTFVPDPTFYKRLLEKWNCEYTPPGTPMKRDTIQPLGKVTFWMVAPVRTDTGYWSPHLTFDIYNKKDKDYCYRQSGKIKDNPNCPPEARGGDIYSAGDFLFVNREDCPDCIAYFTGANFCKSNMRLIFKHTKVAAETVLPEVIAALPVEKGVYRGRR